MTRRSLERDAGAPVEEILGERLDAFEHWCAALAREPSEEPVHEVRVATRRLLAALTLFTPLLELPEDVDPDVLHRVERRLGRLRDLDVLTARIRTEPAFSTGESWTHGPPPHILHIVLAACPCAVLEDSSTTASSLSHLASLSDATLPASSPLSLRGTSSTACVSFSTGLGQRNAADALGCRTSSARPFSMATPP